MCMMLYIGSDILLPVIPFDNDTPAFHTKELREEDRVIINHFSSKHVLYAGSSEGCGCSFKHALIDSNTNWLNVVGDEANDYRRNMLQLYEYVENIIAGAGKVELYACWDGDFEDPALSKEVILPAELLNDEFYLKEKGFYIIE